MRMTSSAIRLACFAVGAVLSAAVPASASGLGGSGAEVALVHQDLDGSLWYSYGDGPGIKLFITTAPCWIDHDHVRLGGEGRVGCAAYRP